MHTFRLLYSKSTPPGPCTPRFNPSRGQRSLALRPSLSGAGLCAAGGPQCGLQHGTGELRAPFALRRLRALELGCGATVGGLWPCAAPWVGGVPPPRSEGFPPLLARSPPSGHGPVPLGLARERVCTKDYAYTLGAYSALAKVGSPLAQSDSQCEVTLSPPISSKPKLAY